MLSLALALAMMMSLVSCGNNATPAGSAAPSGDADAPAKTADALEVAYLLPSAAVPFWVYLQNGIQEKCDEYGYNLTVYDSNNEASTQLKNAQNAIKLNRQAPKVRYFEEVLHSASTYTTTQIAKELGMSGRKLNYRLKQLGVQFRQSGTWMLTARYHKEGYTRTHTHVWQNRNGHAYRMDGTRQTFYPSSAEFQP